VERNGKALLLAGPSGAGKSTLCAALITRGWRLLSDEAAMIRPDDGLIQPYPRPICLKNASIDLIAEAVPDAHIRKGFDTLAGLVEACDHYNLFYRSLDDALGMIEQLEPAAGRIGRVA
jgi:ABC-type cobalamin/Fe3+-siderophores transport system ATPase subunit